jgi:cation:H+ antiporter
MVAGVLLVVSFAVMVAGAAVFTNAVEWAGLRLGLGHGAVGSVLAAVATAMPESLIPVIAIITEGKQAGPVAIGAIVGAPFLSPPWPWRSAVSPRSSTVAGGQVRGCSPTATR